MTGRENRGGSARARTGVALLMATMMLVMSLPLCAASPVNADAAVRYELA